MKKKLKKKTKTYLKKYSLKDVVDYYLRSEKTNKKKIYKICLGLKKMKKIISLILIFFLTSCTTARKIWNWR